MNLREFLNLGYYTSKLDEFLEQFRQKHPRLSASQQQEKDKYTRIYALRDNPNQPAPSETFWDKF